MVLFIRCSACDKVLEKFTIDTPVEIVNNGVHACRSCEMASNMELRVGQLNMDPTHSALAHCTFRDYTFREFEPVKFGSVNDG
jgi:hypothetical protein